MARSYQNAVNRWAGVGPYYAMFPVSFADKVIKTYTRPGDSVLDPFAGRGTAVFSAATQNRPFIGIEVNPVGYVYASAKLQPADQRLVEKRLDQLGGFSEHFKNEARCLPRFFHRCFSRRVRRFLLAARANLDWRGNGVDRTLMALLLVYLHGKEGAALSNQMRQTKSMSPQYAVRWWDERGLQPPDIDPVAFVKKRVIWRYAKGTPKISEGNMYLGNSTDVLVSIDQHISDGLSNKVKLLFTSPPYHAVTNYHYDQWIRLWLLGRQPNALLNGGGRCGRFGSREKYIQLLDCIFTRAARILTEDSIVYVRTDRREFTYRTTRTVLQKVFPDKKLEETSRPMVSRNQTQLFGATNESAKGMGEVDLVLIPQ